MATGDSFSPIFIVVPCLWEGGCARVVAGSGRAEERKEFRRFDASLVPQTKHLFTPCGLILLCICSRAVSSSHPSLSCLGPNPNTTLWQVVSGYPLPSVRALVQAPALQPMRSRASKQLSRRALRRPSVLVSWWLGMITQVRCVLHVALLRTPRDSVNAMNARVHMVFWLPSSGGTI